MRIQAHFFGEVDTHDGDLKFRFKRVQGGATTYVKHSNDKRGTLSIVSHDSSGLGTTQQPWQIIAFDSNNSLGQITYTLQIADHGGGTFYLNRTYDQTDTADRELLNSTIEVEEILTGPPLTVNNVAVSGTPNTNDVLQYNGSAWTTVQSLASDYIYVYRTTNASRYYTTNTNSKPILLWEGSQSSSSDLSWASNGEITVPAGVYLAILNHNFKRDYTYGSTYYQTLAGIFINSTSVAEVADENGKESGTNSGRSIYGNVNLSRIITVSNGDVVKFYHRTYYMGIVLMTPSYALLLRIG
jgi:hypothetical protein